MPSRAEMETDAERRIREVIDRHGPPIRSLLYVLDPLEALGLLGDLTADTFARFKPSSRLDLAEGWTQMVLTGVRENIDAAGNARRD